MLSRKLSLLLMCFATGILAFAALEFWSKRNAPLYKRFENQWSEDVEILELSGKLPPSWFDVSEIELFGGTPESKNWLRRIQVPLAPKRKEGKHKLEILVVAWEDSGRRGAMVQYNLVEKESKNMVFELGRTFILAEPKEKPR